VIDASQAEASASGKCPRRRYKEQLQSAFADLQNVGGRPAGSITAAMFLREFVGETPWVHLDIAAPPGWTTQTLHVERPTGFGVRTFARLARSW